MRIEDHCGMVTPVVSFAQESVMVLLFLPIAARTGGRAFAPIPALEPAAVMTS